MDFLDTLKSSPEDIILEGGDVGFLIAHSIGGAPDECAHLAEQLAQRGYAVSSPLLLGHGGSQILLGATGGEHWLATLVHAHDALAARCSQIVVVGYLTGALLALRLAQSVRARPVAVILAAPAIWPPGWEAGPMQRLLLELPVRLPSTWMRLAERHPYGIGDSALRDEALSVAEQDSAWHNGVFRRTGAVAFEAQRIATEALGDLDHVVSPTLVLMARADGQGDLDFAERLQRKLGGRVEVMLLDDTLYRVLEDHQRDLVAEQMLQFVEAALTEQQTMEALLSQSGDLD